MTTFALVLRPDRADVVQTARRIIEWLEAHGHAAVVLAADPGRLDGVAGVDADAIRDGVDAVVSLGGDGTILRTAALLEGVAVPVLGVNLGKLAYLADIEPDHVLDALEVFLARRHRIEDRMLLDVAVSRADGSTEHRRALNEAVVEKTLSGHTVRIEVTIDGMPFTPYETDALIVATPTGSTAYAFSARGPILSATHRALLLTPVSPHMLFDRSLVLEPDAVIDLVVAGSREATLLVDGRPIAALVAGDRVSCTGSADVVRLARFTPRSFTGILKAKFGLSDR